MFFLSCGSVSSIICASKPTPPIIMNACGWSSFGSSSRDRRPTSTFLEPCDVAMVRAASKSSTGMLRLRANRLPVPIGRMPIACPLPDIALATVRTVPSPPTATTTSAPCPSASSVHARPSLSSCVSMNSICLMPLLSQNDLIWRRRSLACGLDGLMMNA